MNGIFNEESTVVVRRAAAVKVEQKSTPNELTVDLEGSDSLINNLVIYGSPLLNAASDLLGILVTIPRQSEPENVDRFRQNLLEGIARFRQNGIHLEYHPSIIEKSCFILCAAFDEAILYTHWGEKVRWENHSLLSKLFSERNGGEVFFKILDKACQQPNKLVDFIELQYLMLVLGFQGRYRDHDESLLHEIKSDVYNIVSDYRFESNLPIPKTPDLPESKTPLQMIGLTKLAIFMLLFVLLGYTASEYMYFDRSRQVIDEVHAIEMSGMKIANGKNAHSDSSNDVISDDSSFSLGKDTENLMRNVHWEILLGIFSNYSDASRLVNLLKNAGYKIHTRETENGIEIVSKSNPDLSEVRKLKNEINIQYGLNATVRKAK
ncbi:type IVB secretion system protein IcmH/DotU [Shewanella sp. 202IG2-18]|uniref:type IVB secretion system protein IcmH/DotU n=1 Tax=Parashewanella hymeniacidonis TaxID=2807618 RepID=UPI0019615915|nr:type IVB secretion system protein IcmH/DotU [Parashewanella hymeniacidonis]MBM7071358.1 type IVB secretion system protein IcmH/DotU [Parashewanella hymeniacidonis]